MAKKIDEQEEETGRNGGNKMNKLCGKVARKEKLLRSMSCWVGQPAESPGKAWRIRKNVLFRILWVSLWYIFWPILAASDRNRRMGKMKAPEAVEK